MSIIAAIGQSQSLDAREAAGKAARQALDQIGNRTAALGWLIASHDFPVYQVVNGASGVLGNIPLFGFSTPGELTTAGQSQRTVIVALISGEDLQARADWWPGFGNNSHTCTLKMIEALHPETQQEGSLFVAADGLNGDAALLCASLVEGNYTLAGLLAGGSLQRGSTYQIGGRQCGTSGLSAIQLTGSFVSGVGASHGWQPVGISARVTRSTGIWVQELDGMRASESYARLFGYPSPDWAFPPLAQLVRLYPLGIEQDATEKNDSPAFQVRSPLHIEADGSLRMNTAVPEGAIVHFLVGSVEGCLSAVKHAAQQALDNLGGARPVLAVIFADVAYKTLLEALPGSEADTIRATLGPDVPIIGGYTFGQLARHKPSGPAELLNQHVQVVLFGEPIGG
jgi:hypothetical protein